MSREAGQQLGGAEDGGGKAKREDTRQGGAVDMARFNKLLRGWNRVGPAGWETVRRLRDDRKWDQGSESSWTR